MYELMQLSDSDKKKIVSDVSASGRDVSGLVLAINRGDFVSTWAVDSENKNYLVSAPVLMREYAMDRPYYAFVLGELYEFRSIGWVGDEAYFVGDVAVSDEVKSEIVLAFSVYGRWGKGVLNEKVHPEFKFIPDFSDEK